MFKKLATDQQNLQMCGYVTTRLLLMPQACDGQQAICQTKGPASLGVAN